MVTTSNSTPDPIYGLTLVVQGTTTTESYSCYGVGNRLIDGDASV